MPTSSIQFSNQQLATLQAGTSVQRKMVATNANSNSSMANQTINRISPQTVYSNITIFAVQFLECNLDNISFVKSTLVDTDMESCTGSKPSFFGATLSDCSFKSTLLTKADFNQTRIANLSLEKGTKLSNCKFTDSFIYDTTLDQSMFNNPCTFHNTTFRECDFSNTTNMIPVTPSTYEASTFDTCTFTSVQFGNKTDFTEAVLRNCTILGTSSFQNSVFNNGHIVKCSFTTGSSLVGAQLINVELMDSTMDGMQFSDNLSGGASFNTSQFKNVSLKNVVAGACSFVKTTFLNNCDFTGAQLNRADFTGATLSDVDFNDIILSDDQIGATFQGATLENTTFLPTSKDINLQHTDFNNANLSQCSFGNDSGNSALDSANFDHAQISDTTFENCNLSSASFRSTQFVNVTFTNCNLAGATVTGASLKNVIWLESSNLPTTWTVDPKTNIVTEKEDPLPISASYDPTIVGGDAFNRPYDSTDTSYFNIKCIQLAGEAAPLYRLGIKWLIGGGIQRVFVERMFPPPNPPQPSDRIITSYEGSFDITNDQITVVFPTTGSGLGLRVVYESSNTTTYTFAGAGYY